MKTIAVPTGSQEEIIDITHLVYEAVSESNIQDGFCQVFIPHTTAGITINENADPSVKRDILMTLHRAVPDSLPYTHAEGNSPAHVKASMMGFSIWIMIEAGRLLLGTWQGICFCEFDGPRNRKAYIKFLPVPA